MTEFERVKGYHGTSVDCVEDILKDGFTISRNEYDWLGNGIYFWQDIPARALEWAIKQHGSKAIVLGAVIRLEDCLDFLDPSWSNFLATAYDLFVTKSKLAQIRIPKQDPSSGARRLDREVINYACGISGVTLGIQFRVVRGVFQEGRPVYPNSGLYTHSHIQIAVRDPSVIEDCKIEEVP